MKWMSFIAIPALVIGLMSCSKKKDEPATASTNITTTISSNLSTVSAGFAPASLAVSPSVQFSSLRENMEISSGGPCGTASFFDCQAILVRLYLTMAKQFVDMTNQVIAGVGSGLGQLADGASGSAASGDGYTFHYNKTDANNFAILGIKDSSSQPGIYLNVSSTVYTLKVDTAQMDSNGSTAKVSAVINYTDASTWSIDMMIDNPTCDANDVEAPSKIKIKLSKASGLWTGKAMMYHPRWANAGTPTCATTPSASTSVALYTDFVGNDSAAKASVYLIPVDQAGTTYSSYGLDNFCNNFGSVCSGGMSGVMTNYPNPFCATSSGSTFNSTCSSVDATVAAASYSAASNWTAPATYVSESVTLPSSLSIE
ncbi:MAG: hypothetical protein BroJett040_21970 [Oligoflexia bacterium]|nr:MAG: hypothetical protein BroJett040_21970 [Oligoflexia bacterium]